MARVDAARVRQFLGIIGDSVRKLHELGALSQASSQRTWRLAYRRWHGSATWSCISIGRLMTRRCTRSFTLIWAILRSFREQLRRSSSRSRLEQLPRRLMGTQLLGPDALNIAL